MVTMSEQRTPRAAVAGAYLRLPHALPVAIVVATTGALSLVVERSAPLSTHTAILLAMLGAQVVIGVVNELVDVDLDRSARPDKPLVSGLVTRRGASVLLVGAAAVMIAAGATLGIPALLVCLLGCALGIAYRLWLKRTLFAFLPYVLAIPLLPIWVALAHDELDAGWLLLFPIGAFALTGVQIAQSLPDIDSDRAAGIRSLTTALGERRAIVACWCLLLTSAAIGAISNSDEAVAWTAAACVGLGVSLNAWGYRSSPRRAVRQVFPTAAISVAILGIAWVYASGTK
jgi:4-hydroxybenzoate polyprenyltransferase